MKKHFFGALMLLTSLLALASSCSDSEEGVAEHILEVEPTSLDFKAHAYTQEVKIKTNIPDLKLKISEDGQWCTGRFEDDKLVLSVTANNNKEVRSTTVIVYRNEKSKKITVRQLGSGLAILVSPTLPASFDNLPSEETDICFTVTTNVESFDVVTPAWILQPHNDDLTRSGEMIDYPDNNYTVEANMTTKKRTGTIIIKASNPEYSLKEELQVTQAGMPEYDPGAADEVKDDIKVVPDKAEASSTNDKPPYGPKPIENTIDGKYNTIWHSALKSGPNADEGYWPVTLTYYFDNTASLDYLIYYPRQDANKNGRFKQTKIYYKKKGDTEFTKITDKDFEGSTEVTRVDFPEKILNPVAVQIEIYSGEGDNGGFASCAEMEFYQKNPDNFDWTILFTDATCSKLKTGITEEEINNCPYQFYKNLAGFLYKGTYPSEFRVQEYKPYPHPDIQAATNKTNPYSLLDNPTGISVNAGEALMVFVGEMHGQKINLRVQNLDQPTKDGFGGNIYPLHEGQNKLAISNPGLIYVMYHTSTLEEAETAQPIKIHIASGTVNGYYDSKKHEASRWNELIGDATYKYFDVLGEYAHLTFPTASLSANTTSGKALIDLYDEVVYNEMKFMGLEKYDCMFRNRMYLHITYKTGAFMYATSYHTAYSEGTIDGLCNENNLKSNIWGPAHEIGHCNQTRPGLKWLSTTEVTNNICAMHVQTLFSNKYNTNYIRLPNEDLSAKGFTNRYEKAMTNILATQKALVLDDDPFSRLVPFWQLELYMNNVLGKEDFYKDLYQLIREEKDINSVGGNQLEFVARASKIANLDLSDFFTKWGFLTPVDIEVSDYAKGQMTITQSQADEICSRISQYPRPVHNFEYICEQNIDVYKKNVSIQKGIAKRTKNKLTMTNWQNVVAYEVYNGKQLIFVSPMPSFTVNQTLDETIKVYAISAKGDKVEVTF